MHTHLSSKILPFLKDLAENNHKDWFEANKPTFQELNKNFKSFALEVQEAMNAHDDIDKAKIFRIYRDVRFSKDKTPYKTNFGAAFHRRKPALRGGYYLHLQPGNCFLAVGFWAPEKEDLLRIRKEFEIDDAEFREILATPSFAKIWGDLQGDELKTAPKGFDKEHPAIDLIRKKQYYFTLPIPDDKIRTADFLPFVVDSYAAARPYVDYMSSVLTTDLNGVSLID